MNATSSRSPLVILLVLACGGVLTAAPQQKLVVYPAPPAGSVKASEDYRVHVNGREVFAHTAQVLHGGPASFAAFDFAGSVDVTITPKGAPQSVVVRPLSAGVRATIQGGGVRFTLRRPCNLSVEVNGWERPLLLFANPIETDVPKPGDPNVLYFGPGVHEIGTTEIKSGTTVYLAGGAVVRGKLMEGEEPRGLSFMKKKTYRPLFVIEGAKDVVFRGRGLLDMSGLDWHAKTTFVFRNCVNCRVEGIIVQDAPAWVVAMFGCRDMRVDNVKQVCHRENSDGVDAVNTQNVLVENCFLRNNDDEICVKTTAGPPAQESRDILVRKCVIWNDRAYALGVTYETRADVKNLRFQDCDVIHDHGIGSLAIHVSDSATIQNVAFDDIRIEDTRNRLIRIWIGKDMWGKDDRRGQVRDVIFRKIAIMDGPQARVELHGHDATYRIENVLIDGMTVRGKPVTDLAGAKASVRHAEKVVVK